MRAPIAVTTAVLLLMAISSTGAAAASLEPVAFMATSGQTPSSLCSQPNIPKGSEQYRFCFHRATQSRPLQCKFTVTGSSSFELQATTVEHYNGRSIDGRRYPRYVNRWIRIDHGDYSSSPSTVSIWRIRSGTCGANTAGRHLFMSSAQQVAHQIRVSLALACPSGFRRDDKTHICSHYTREISDRPASDCPLSADPVFTNKCVDSEPAPATSSDTASAVS
jgi:hypothetical protein